MIGLLVIDTIDRMRCAHCAGILNQGERERNPRTAEGQPIHHACIEPYAALRPRLDAATPTMRDFVLYCPACAFVGETNAAYAASFMADHSPPSGARCPGALRIWRHTPRIIDL